MGRILERTGINTHDLKKGDLVIATTCGGRNVVIEVDKPAKRSGRNPIVAVTGKGFVVDGEEMAGVHLIGPQIGTGDSMLLSIPKSQARYLKVPVDKRDDPFSEARTHVTYATSPIEHIAVSTPPKNRRSLRHRQ